MTMPTKLKNLLTKLKVLHIIVVALALALIFILYQYYIAQNELKNFKTNPEQAASYEIEKIAGEVGKLIDLPQGETPTIATVTDPQKLNDQAFFEKAEVGDKVLIYNNAKKAILYRQSTKKVLEVAPINIGEQKSTAASPTQQEIKFVILNGTSTVGLAGKYRDIVSQKITDAQIVSVGNYSQNNIEKTFIAQSANTNSNQQEEIAKTLEIETGVVNSSQIDKEVDFIIVVGADKSSI